MNDRPNPSKPPIAGFVVGSLEPSVGQTVRLVDTSSDPEGIGIAWRAWDFGDDATGTGVSPSHRYRASGRYTITLTVATFDGRTAQAQRDVIVGAATRCA
jgi:PKD repeat protein